MNTVGVLLVDDVPGERANFEHAFGHDLTVAPSIDQLNEQLRRGFTWDLAFVDFNLSSQTSTGLTACCGYTTSVRLPGLRLPPNRGGIDYKESHAREAEEV